jgi:hypothetical protein
MENHTKIYEMASGDIAVWVDEGAGCICIKTRNKYQDPVELSEDEALGLANLLINLVNEMKN